MTTTMTMTTTKAQETSPRDVMSEWNPRYVAYASAHGRTPEEQDAADENGAPYINWINRRILEWRDEKGLPRDRPLSVAEHIDLNEWLAARFPAVVREPLFP